MKRRATSGTEFWSRKDTGLRAYIQILILVEAATCYPYNGRREEMGAQRAHLGLEIGSSRR